MSDFDINQLAKSTGLSAEEARVLQIIALEGRSLNITELSSLSNVPRSTLYRICEELIQTGFCSWVQAERGREVVINDPDQLEIKKKEAEDDYLQTKESITNLQSFIQDNKKAINKTKVRYYSGVEGLQQLIWNTLQAETEILGYSEFGRRKVVGDKFYDSYVEEFKIRRLSDRVIGNENALDYIGTYVKKHIHQLELEDVRIISKDKYYVTGDTTIYNNTYAVCWWNQGEIVGVEIENPELVKLQRSIFELMWEIADPLDEHLA